MKLPNDENAIIVVCYRSPNCDNTVNDNINRLINDVNSKFSKEKTEQAKQDKSKQSK